MHNTFQPEKPTAYRDYFSEICKYLNHNKACIAFNLEIFHTCVIQIIAAMHLPGTEHMLEFIPMNRNSKAETNMPIYFEKGTGITSLAIFPSDEPARPKLKIF